MIWQAILSMDLHIVSISQKRVGPFLFVAGLGLVLGMRHSTDADHVIAISTIVTRQKSIRGAAIIGSVWGIGHTITIFMVGSLIILFKGGDTHARWLVHGVLRRAHAGVVGAFEFVRNAREGRSLFEVGESSGG